MGEEDKELEQRLREAKREGREKAEREMKQKEQEIGTDSLARYKAMKKAERKRNILAALLFIAIIIAVWSLPPLVATYALFNWTTIYAYSGYTFNQVLLAIWAVWTIVFVFFGWLLNNYREGEQIGAAIAQDIIEERELRRKLLDRLEQEEQKKQ